MAGCSPAAVTAEASLGYMGSVGLGAVTASRASQITVTTAPLSKRQKVQMEGEHPTQYAAIRTE